jgi:hypothetical protein
VTTRSSTPKPPPPPPSWATDGTQLIACLDGPLVNQWFFLAQWQERVSAAKNMAALGQRRSPVLDYAPDGTTVAHPQWPMAHGSAMRSRRGGRS